MSKETDSQLVGLAREGDISAFEMIVERYRAVLIAKANARLGSLADAEDVAQEAFVQAYFHLHELREPEALLGWLRKMTDRIALMRLRKHHEEAMAPERLEIVADSNAHNGTPLEEVELGSILAQLPETMREAVSLTFLAGYTCAEAGRIMGVKEGTVKSRLNRARAKLKEALEMTGRDMVGGKATGDFTTKTIERLTREARKLIAKGEFDEARKRAEAILCEQVKPLFGNPSKLGVAKTFLAAYESAAFKPDEEAVAMLGLPKIEQRHKECEANAAQYGFRLEDLDWKLEDVNIMSGTIGRPTGQGKDIWGVPVSRMKLNIIDARALGQRLKCSPETLYEWVKKGCPILRCWPFARFDVERVEKWLADNAMREWPTENEYDLERPIRIVFKAVYEGHMSPEQAEEIMKELGYGVWEAPHQLKGGW